jgi:hypothetical protein
MTNDEFQNLVLENFGDLKNDVSDLKADVSRLEKTTDEIKRSQTRMENDSVVKISALFDGYTLRGEQIKNLQEHLDERLDTIQLDLSYLVSKTAKHERSILKLRQAK